MQTKILEDIGLSKNEIEVFISLLKLGESKAELLPVCEKVGSEFYKFACKKSLEKNTKNAK